MQIEVTEGFIDHRTEKTFLYNTRKRSTEKFLMDLDAELLEYHMIHNGYWEEHESWMVDAIDDHGQTIDVKFIDKWYNISNQKMLNILQQRNILDVYSFWEYTERPDRPMRQGDKISVRHVNDVSYGSLADNIRVSRGKWGGFYADPRGMSRRSRTALPQRNYNNRGLPTSVGTNHINEFTQEERQASIIRERMNG